MRGNVLEWLEDVRHGHYKEAPDDGRAWIDEPRGADRVFCGGSWFNVAHACRAAIRNRRRPYFRYNNVGFRLARSFTLAFDP